MANKLAGQRAKFTKAMADYQRTEDEAKRTHAARLMAEVLAEAPRFGFTREQVSQGADIPADVQQLIEIGAVSPDPGPESADQLVHELEEIVDRSDCQVCGSGNQSIYAYGYRCAPDRLKIGRTDGDVVERVARQISTGTPDRPSLVLVIKTSNSRALEMAIHGILQIRDCKVTGGGDEWFRTTRDELLEICNKIPAPGVSAA